jgi:hypothetical protein
MASQTHLLAISPSPDSPARLIEAIVAEAWADADRVAALLQKFDPPDSTSSPMSIGRDLALFLGAFLRLAEWERLGLRIHLDAGLPTASRAFADAHRSAVESGTIPWAGELWASVWKLFFRRCAWHGRSEFGVTVALDFLDEAAALDALAEFLWHRRKHMRGEDA